MNQYLQNLNKIEFVITYACTGRCKHCSEGDHTACGEHIDTERAVRAVRGIASAYDIKTVMTFGGEPLLFPDTVCEIMACARELGIPKRQLITNGYFSKDTDAIRHVALKLCGSGVNDVLLSVDAFHQETIPIEYVRAFARELKSNNTPVRLQPAWLVGPHDDNPYNEKTRKILNSLADTDIPEGRGNVIFPQGNALKYLAEYLTDAPCENPYEEDPYNVRCVSFSPNGDVLDGNIYRCDIADILDKYKP